MADGLNSIRAIRISEIMTDFRNIQARIAAIRVSPSAEEYNEDGFVLLRQCVSQAQQLLARPFQNLPAVAGAGVDDEVAKQQLRRIILDASLRRFQAQQILLRASAALRWVTARQRIQQQDLAPGPLQQIRNTLRTELAAITDARVDASLRQADAAEGKWLAEDPSLSALQRATRASG